MLVADVGGKAIPTKVAKLLSNDGVVTSDDYFHFWAQTFTDPAPAFREWSPTASPRFPLLFTLKFLLARAAVGNPVATYSDIIGSYEQSGFDGDEDQSAFITLAKKDWQSDDHRQARESIQVISQISYLSATSSTVTVSFDAEAALDVFLGLAAVK
ncbi:MAG: HNH endonuclease, partial [Novosphingobium sp.]|nr:HNH endonuclease [Novosphingobium sp.]